MEESVTHILLSDLLHRLRPITAAYSLSTTTQIHRPVQHKHNPQPSSYTNPNSSTTQNILKPLHSPSFLTGTLTLTSLSTCLNSACLQFTEDSASVCCDIIDFDLRIIGRKIKLLAWNFIPVKTNCGFLEITRWTFDQSEKILVPNYNAFYLNSILPVYEESVVPRNLIFGLLESVSPVMNVPCTANKSGAGNINGFLAEVIVCECELCSCRDRVMFLGDLIGEQNKSHKFSKSKILYFCGSASIWYPAVSRLVGGILLISGMKKKMVFLEERKSLMMYVTTEKTIIHFPMCSSKRMVNGINTYVNPGGLCSVYTGSITAVYMQGMVIELDQKVLLLLTDHQLSMPHSLRLGAVITVRNFHVEDPKFAWTDVKVFGSCYKTSIRVNIFSPIENRCYQVIQSRSLLRKFIESLTFSARIWVLLVISSLRKKFSGVLSEIEILGSKHTEGLVQKYSSSCLPLSVFRFRHGVLSEYCLHDVCGCGKEIDYNPPKLVVPISNLISQCENMFVKSLYASRTDSDTKSQLSFLVCGGKSHDRPIRKSLKSEEMNVVLLGSLKISAYPGRLQLMDTTGSIDIIIPDLPSFWSTKDIYEINDYTIVMEGFPRQLEHAELVDNEPFSCGNIFNHFHSTGRKKINIYVHCYIRDAKLKNHILCPSVDMEEKYKELESGRFHLLSLVHKFPVQQRFRSVSEKSRDGNIVLNNSSVYAEAIVLPWNLVLYKRDRDSLELADGGHYQKNPTYNEKQCDLSCLTEFPCTIDYQTYSDAFNCTVANMQEDSSYKRATRKILLEFKSDSLSKYESLRIGGYYMIKHHGKDLVCTAKDGKVLVNSKSHLWSVSFCAGEAGLATARSSICSNDKSTDSRQVKIRILRSINGCPEICPDIKLHLSVDHFSFLEIKVREQKENLIRPTNSIKGLFNSSRNPGTMMSAAMPCGNLISVQGHVLAVHGSDHSRHIYGGHHHIFPGITHSVCIHVLIDDHKIVRIYSSLSEQSYPIGFGSGVIANFHRVLLTAEGDVLKLTPASFIEINSIITEDEECNKEWDELSVKSVLEINSSLTNGPATLISEIKHKQMRLHCKVVAIYVLVVEKNGEFIQSSRVNSKVPCMKIPLVGFIMDDGSSSCCCWTDNETAMTLLCLHEQWPCKRSRRSLRKSNNMDIDTMSRLNKILERHGTIVMKNLGSVSDSSCLDVAVSVNSNNRVRESDEQFLKSLVLKACTSNTWNVIGTVLDSEATNQLAERLRGLDMRILPIQNIWAVEVSHLDMLNEGRFILQELLKPK